MTRDLQQALGLSSEQVRQRLEQGLGNRVRTRAGQSTGEIILSHTVTFFNFVFAVMAAVLALCGSSIKNMTFLIVVVINTVIGIAQQLRAKRALEKLTLVAQRSVPAYRDGKLVPVPSELLVQDDVVELGPGDQVCADGTVCAGALQVNEALVTGEQDAIAKHPGDDLKSGSFVVSGRGQVRLTRVGQASYAARLAAEAKKNPRAGKSELMGSLDKLIRTVGIGLIPIGLILFYHQFHTLGLGLTESAEACVAALVGMIPEGLYLLTSVALAVSALKLTRQRVLVQDMNCIEALSRVDVLCVDKTGTITEPELEVCRVIPLEGDAEPALRALFGSRPPDNDTARAMREYFPGPTDWVCESFIPFASEHKWSGGVFAGHGAYLVGAPEVLGMTQAQEYAAQGYRVLLAARYEGIPQPGALLQEKLTPMALVLLSSRIRPSAPETFSYFARQGVAVKVISGDNPATVSQVARRAGIALAERCVDASSLTDEELCRAAQEYTVFGRVDPRQKRLLIRAMKEQGHTVAMTGDGVNDVLAMKEADCAIAMASGAQAASQVAHTVLLDSDFSAMPGIVVEGRRVINNIRRAATLFLVKNIFSMLLAVITVFTRWAYPFAPLNLTVISALTIGTPAFFLALEPNYQRVAGKFLPTVLRRALPGGLTNILMLLAAQTLMELLHLPQAYVGTVCTAVLAAVGMWVLFDVSRPFDSFRKVVWGAMGAALVLCFTVLRGFLELPAQGIGTLALIGGLVLAAPMLYWLLCRVLRKLLC